MSSPTPRRGRTPHEAGGAALAPLVRLGAPIAGAILNSEFHPARSGACAVKLIVYQRIGLRINVPAGRGPPSAQPLPNPPPSLKRRSTLSDATVRRAR